MKKHYETHVEDTDKLISVAGPILEYKSWYEQYRKLMEEQAQRKYGLYTPTSEGDEDDFPSIPGMIARYSASGLTNEQMKENPVWVDKTGNGHDLQMKNFLWGEMSGVGGYNQNFNQYFVGVDESNKTVSDSSMKLVLLESDSQKVIYDRNSYQIGHTYNFYIKVTGIEGRMLNVNAGTLGGRIMSITEDGIYSINVTVSDSWGQNRLYLIFPPSSSSNTITIEQLPLYPGALVFDGVDDYGTCDNFPILTKEKGYTVVALRSIIDKNIPGYLLSNSAGSNQGAFIFERTIDSLTASFGKSSPITVNYNNPLTYQTTSKYNQKSISVGELLEGGKSLVVGRNSKEGNLYANAAIWELVFLDHDATEEELTKIKDYFVKTYPWLFPDQAWTVVGKTNEDEDRATIANITGNGNDLVLSNFGFAEGSGYNEEGEYAGYLVTDGVDDRVVSSSFTLNKDWTIVGNWKMLQPEANKLSGIVKQNSLFIYNHVDGLNISINDAWNFFKLKDIRSVNAICSDGRIYLNDWTEIIDSKQQTVNESVGTLVIGILGNVYTSLAFKNLGFYNNQNLSKDDCIKAYNYLQTLKAK